MSNHINNKRIVKNALFLYFRMLLTLGVTLYTSRVVLNELGIEDYGVYNVVGGVVTLFSFLSGAMSSATQRFLSFELGANNKEQLHNVFKMSINIHVIITLLIIILAETLGLWFLNNQLIISPERLNAANWVFQCALIAFGFTIMGVPYNAIIIAYERMSAFAYISIADVLFKLGVVFILGLNLGDKLKIYALLTALVSILIWFCYYSYNRLSFTITKYSFFWDKNLFKTLVSYTGWNFFGNLAAVGANQGINIVINLFFGPAVNAARAIAYQVNSAVSGFVTNLQMSINPQIVKSYAADDRKYMQQLVFLGAKYSFFLLYLITLPILLKTENVLVWWLKVVPENTVVFCKLIIIDSLIISISGSLMTAFQATGKIKSYQIIIGLILLLNVPVSYYILKLGFESKAVFFVSISLSVISLIFRVCLLNKLLSKFMTGFGFVILRITSVLVMSLIPSWWVSSMMDDSFFDFLVMCLFSWIITLTCIWLIGVADTEKEYIKSKIFMKIRI